MTKTICRLFLIAMTLTILTVATTGCGPDPVNMQESGALEAGDSTHPADGSFYDPYEFRVKEGWAITVTMTSTEVSPYLQLRIKDKGDEGLVEQSGANGSAVLTTTATESGTYVVWANSMSSGETGAYNVLISAGPAQ